jgi:transcription termination/antitermination protein NusG
MNNGLKWFAVYTKPRWEKKVAELLSLKQVENYCPLQKLERRWSDRKKIILDPLFKSYVFVQIPDKGQLPVVQTDGVLKFVTYLGKPAVIRNEEIDLIKQFLKDHQNIQVEKIGFSVNDQVRFVRGPLMEQEGSVLEVKNRTVKVLLPSLGFALVATEISNIEKNSNKE